MPRARSRSRSRSPQRNRSRSITPVYNSFSGLSLNQRQPPRLTRTTRMQRRIPSPVPGQANRNDSFTSAFRRLNFDNNEVLGFGRQGTRDSQNEEPVQTQPPVPGSRPTSRRRFQQRVMSSRRSTKFWKFTKSGKRKNISRGSFLKSRRKAMKKRSYKKRSKRSRSRSRSKRSRRIIRKSRKSRPCLRKSYAPGYRFDGTGINVKTGKREKFYVWPSKNCRQ